MVSNKAIEGLGATNTLENSDMYSVVGIPHVFPPVFPNCPEPDSEFLISPC